MLQEAQETLESKSLWYKYKTSIWLSETPQEAVVHNIMRALRSISFVGGLAYVSVPITSGKFLYELKLTNPLMSNEEQINKAIEHNYFTGLQFLEKLKKRIDCPVLYPADLVPIHQQWEQAHFQALWLSIIAEMCTEVHMTEGWEFSNGGSEEFTHVMQLKLGLPRHNDLLFFNTKETEKDSRERMRNIKVYNHYGELLSIHDGIQAIKESLRWLKDLGLKAKTLENSLDLLYWTSGIMSRGFYQ